MPKKKYTCLICGNDYDIGKTAKCPLCGSPATAKSATPTPVVRTPAAAKPATPTPKVPTSPAFSLSKKIITFFKNIRLYIRLYWSAFWKSRLANTIVTFLTCAFLGTLVGFGLRLLLSIGANYPSWLFHYYNYIAFSDYYAKKLGMDDVVVSVVFVIFVSTIGFYLYKTFSKYS